MKNSKDAFMITLLCGMAILFACCKDLQHSPRKQRKMLARYGIREPRIENEETLLSAARKYGLDTAYLVTVNEADMNAMLHDFSNSIPEAIIFNRKGHQIYYKDSTKVCNAGLFSFIPALDRAGAYKYGDGITLEQEMSKVKNIRGNKLAATYLDTTADFYILLSWAAYDGLLNKDHVKVYQDAAVNNTKAKIQVIEVNFDPQYWWTQTTKTATTASEQIHK